MSKAGGISDRVLEGGARGEPDRVWTLGRLPRNGDLSNPFVADGYDHRIGPANDHTLRASLRDPKAFRVADTEFADGLGQPIGTGSPREPAIPNASRLTGGATGEDLPWLKELAAADDNRSRRIRSAGSGGGRGGAPHNEREQEGTDGLGA